MKNKEKFEKEIMEVACSGDSIAVTKGSERIVQCGSIYCGECLFAPPNCVNEIREWVEQECIEKPVISKKDRAFLEYLGKDLKYIARDKSEALFVYERVSRKGKYGWVYDSGVLKSLCVFAVDFPMVKWSDDKQWLIEDLKNLEVVEEYDE